jgi:hypothetical protein
MHAACARDAPQDAAWRAQHAELTPNRVPHDTRPIILFSASRQLSTMSAFASGMRSLSPCRCLHLPFQAVRSTLLVMVLAALRLRRPPVRRDTDLR